MLQLSWTDAAFIRLETTSAPVHVNPISIYDPSTAPDGIVTFKGILAHLEARLEQAPAFRRKLRRTPLGLSAPYWVDDEDFDLEFHVRHIALPKPGDWRQLCIQLARLHARPIDLSRPPWEITIIEGLDAVEGLPPGCFAMSMKVHHSAIDGTEGVALLTAIHDLEPRPPAANDVARWAPQQNPTGLALLGRTAFSAVRHPVRIVRVLGSNLPSAVRHVPPAIASIRSLPGMAVPRTRLNAAVGPHRVFEARFFDFQDVRKIKRLVEGATVNDVVLALVGGTLRNYLSATDELPDKSLVAMCPISIRRPDAVGAGGNMLSMMRPKLRTDIADPIERLSAITEVTSKDRAAVKAVKAPALLEVAELLPGALVGLGSRAFTLLPAGGPPIANTMVTNVPGAPVPLYLCGAKGVLMTGNGPLTGGLSLIHLITTYAGQFSCSITADRDVLPDPGFYGDCISASFDELLTAV